MKVEGFKTSRVMELYKELKNLEQKFHLSYTELDYYYMENIEAMDFSPESYTKYELKQVQDFQHYTRRRDSYMGYVYLKRLRRKYKQYKTYSETEHYKEEAERAICFSIENPISAFITAYEKWGEQVEISYSTVEFLSKETKGHHMCVINWLKLMEIENNKFYY